MNILNNIIYWRDYLSASPWHNTAELCHKKQLVTQMSLVDNITPIKKPGWGQDLIQADKSGHLCMMSEWIPAKE